jgi:uncharacterized protein
VQCPVCNVALVMSERQGVEIDYCPQCRGVWLDRGELDKILERSASMEAGRSTPAGGPVAAPGPPGVAQPFPPGDRGPRPRDRDWDDDDDDDYRGRRRRNWLADLFD